MRTVAKCAIATARAVRPWTPIFGNRNPFAMELALEYGVYNREMTGEYFGFANFVRFDEIFKI